MTKPSDFSPAQAIEIENASDSRGLYRLIWALRLAGGVLLVAGWLIVSIHHVGSAYFITHTIVFASMGAYGYLAAAASRRVFVNMEKKQRLRLLVHNMELENMAMRDDLTQLFNRRYLFDRLEQELQTAKGFERPLAVIVMDLDSLKAVNDTYGHRLGDRVLASFGQFLLNHTRATDVPARIGGDEFAIILTDTTERGARVMMERLTRDLEETNLIDEDDLTLRLTASLGMSGYPWDGNSVDDIMQHADAAMYASKQARKEGRSTGGDGQFVIPSIFLEAETENESPFEA